MTATRETILANLATRLDSQTDVVTVVRTTYDQVPAVQYTVAQTPILFLVEPRVDIPAYTGSGFAKTTLELDLVLRLLQWDHEAAGATQINTLLDDILDAVHSDITNGVADCFNTSALSFTRTLTDWPLVEYRIPVRVEFYQAYTAR